MTPDSLDEVLTPRMRLVRPVAADFDALFRMHNDPRVSPTLGGPIEEEVGRARHLKNIDHWDRHGFGWWIARDRETDSFLGRGGLRHLVVNERPEIELGYGFAAEAWGRGLATELARQSLQVAFDRLGFTNIVCFTMPTNRASRRVMEKVGFVFERNGDWAGLPHVFYRLTAAENRNANDGTSNARGPDRRSGPT